MTGGVTGGLIGVATVTAGYLLAGRLRCRIRAPRTGREVVDALWATCTAGAAVLMLLGAGALGFVAPGPGRLLHTLACSRADLLLVPAGLLLGTGEFAAACLLAVVTADAVALLRARVRRRPRMPGRAGTARGGPRSGSGTRAPSWSGRLGPRSGAASPPGSAGDDGAGPGSGRPSGSGVGPGVRRPFRAGAEGRAPLGPAPGSGALAAGGGAEGRGRSPSAGRVMASASSGGSNWLGLARTSWAGRVRGLAGTLPWPALVALLAAQPLVEELALRGGLVLALKPLGAVAGLLAAAVATLLVGSLPAVRRSGPAAVTGVAVIATVNSLLFLHTPDVLASAAAQWSFFLLAGA
ncbi:hypothetical protein [Streptomyces sp. MUM 16J]|uniref:hypothetical protein n=1 Tax=Streptomyces sp. MUM 16J TaxID=2791988 RepID=UPI001F03EABC|nr:hypothetical protein [Streptomyces sp. MUM 16J]MCH0555578.1 hypothetical protein [Streptomyces sp. MUM 16J]